MTQDGDRGLRATGGRAFFIALSIIVVIYLFLFGYYLGSTGLRVPVIDGVYWLFHYMDRWLTGDWRTYPWEPHNEHRLIWSRLLFVVDVEWFRGNSLPFLIFGVVCLALMIGAILREVMSSALAPATQVMIAFIVVLLLATTYNGIDWSVPQLGVYLHTSAFFVLALVLLAGKGEGGRHATASRVSALPAAVAAAFGVSGGLLAWPVLHWAAWRGGLGLRWIAAIWLVGGLLIAAYLSGISRAAVTTSLDRPTLLRLFDYVIRFLGLPWSHAGALVWFGRGVGLATLGLRCAAILRFGLIRPPHDRLQRIAVGLLLFSLTTAIVIAASRLNTAPQKEMPIRYTLFTSLAQVALVLLAGPWLARAWAGPKRRPLQATVLAGALLLCAQQILAGRAGEQVVTELTMDYRLVEAGRATPDIVRLVFGNPENAEKALAFIHAHGLYRTDR